MRIETIKKKMLEYKDFYGGDLVNEAEIKSATTKQELASLIEVHRTFMEDMLADAHSHLDHFKNELGLY